MQRYGTCAFCGQERLIEWPEEDPDGGEFDQVEEAASAYLTERLATEQCTCREGQEFRDRKRVISACKRNIEDTFRDSYPEVADIMQEVKELIYDGSIGRVTIRVGENGTAKIYRAKDGIKIEFEKRLKTELLTTC